MAINIAYFLAEIEKTIGEASRATQGRRRKKGMIEEKEWREVVLPRLQVLGDVFGAQISAELLQTQGETWQPDTVEMRLLALGVMLSGWGRWVFRSKLENQSYPHRGSAAAVDKHILDLVNNVLDAADRNGAGAGRPEKRSELIGIS